jgi:hypothetical protein
MLGLIINDSVTVIIYYCNIITLCNHIVFNNIYI